jgi:hypothetical protein
MRFSTTLYQLVGILGLHPKEEYAGGVIYDCGGGEVFMYPTGPPGHAGTQTVPQQLANRLGPHTTQITRLATELCEILQLTLRAIHTFIQRRSSAP